MSCDPTAYSTSSPFFLIQDEELSLKISTLLGSSFSSHLIFLSQVLDSQNSCLSYLDLTYGLYYLRDVYLK